MPLNLFKSITVILLRVVLSTAECIIVIYNIFMKKLSIVLMYGENLSFL